VGCRRVAHPDELVRVVRTPDGGLAMGRDRPGRGAWLCAGSPSCLELARRRKAFERALRGAVEVAAVDDLAVQLRLTEGKGSEVGR
jgi:uncharacterized protein